MKVAFTGTRKGMTREQKRQVASLLRGFSLFEVEAHHGDCIGSDDDFHQLCAEADVYLIVVHPPDVSTYRAFCTTGPRVVTLPRAPYLERNRHIVSGKDILVATPSETEEPPPRRGQGTWSTVRFARRVSVPVVIIWPDGSTG